MVNFYKQWIILPNMRDLIQFTILVESHARHTEGIVVTFYTGSVYFELS